MPLDIANLVKETTVNRELEAFGLSLRAARKRGKITQQNLAIAAGIDLATVQGIERGKGTVSPMLAVLQVLEQRPSGQPADATLGRWIADARRAAGLTQASLAGLIGVSKPTIIQIERGQGNLRSLFLATGALGLDMALVPQLAPQHRARLMCGDCLELLPSIPASSIDAIICDLPFASTELDWDRPIPLVPLWEQFRRILKPTGAVVLNASQPFTTELIASNKSWFKYSLVWQKSRPTGFLHAKHMPLKAHEDICIFSPAVVVGRHRSGRQMTFNAQNLIELEQPKTRKNGLTHGTFIGRKLGNSTVQTHTNYPTSVLNFGSESKPTHPTQKPLELLRYLVRTYSNPGDTVLDCCFGSGTTAVAAQLEGRQFIGMERDTGYFQMAKDRLNRAIRESSASNG